MNINHPGSEPSTPRYEPTSPTLHNSSTEKEEKVQAATSGPLRASSLPPQSNPHLKGSGKRRHEKEEGPAKKTTNIKNYVETTDYKQIPKDVRSVVHSMLSLPASYHFAKAIGKGFVEVDFGGERVLQEVSEDAAHLGGDWTTFTLYDWMQELGGSREVNTLDAISQLSLIDVRLREKITNLDLQGYELSLPELNIICQLLPKVEKLELGISSANAENEREGTLLYLSALHHLPNLRELTLVGDDEVELASNFLEPLYDIPLTHITLKLQDFSDENYVVEYLNNQSTLTNINVKLAGDAALDFKNPKIIKELVIEGQPSELDIHCLTNCTQLESLVLTYCACARGIENLASIKSLQKFELFCVSSSDIVGSNYVRITNLDFLAPHENLRSIKLTQIVGLNNVTVLSHLTNLESVEISDCPQLEYVDIERLVSPLVEVARESEYSLCDANTYDHFNVELYTKVDVRGLLPKIHPLTLADFFQSSPNIVEILITSNDITDLSSLNGLSRLKKVYLVGDFTEEQLGVINPREDLTIEYVTPSDEPFFN